MSLRWRFSGGILFSLTFHTFLISALVYTYPDLLNKDRLLVITKSDLINNDTRKTISNQLSIRHVFISSITNKGLEILKDKIWSLLNKKNDD